MRKKVTTIVIIIVFLAGLSLLLYPFVANQWNNYRQKQLISNYDEQIAQKEAAGEIDYKAEWSKAQAYNEALLPSILPDSFAKAAQGEGEAGYMACLNLLGDGMMGYVQIPKINIKLPIFHTTDEEVLQQAAGHLEGSSLPVGGENTHAVISAHRGLPSAALFTDLDKLEKGDYFLLYILDDVLCYQVDQIHVVEPDQTEDLAVEPGKDLVTLLTCTPYGVNSHRMLVRGHRTPYNGIEDEETPTSLIGTSLHTSYLLWVLVGLAVTGAFILILFLHEKKRRKKALSKETLLEAIRPEEESKDAESSEDSEGSEDAGSSEDSEGSEDTESSEGSEDLAEGQDGEAKE